MNFDTGDCENNFTENDLRALEEGELDSEKEESTAAAEAVNGRGAFRNLVDIEKVDHATEDFSKDTESFTARVSNRFEDVVKRYPSMDDNNDIDEDEMLCIRGASPPVMYERDSMYMSADENAYNDATYYYESDDSFDRGRAARRNRKRKKDRSRKRRKSRLNHKSRDKLDGREVNTKGERKNNSSPKSNEENLSICEDKIDNRKQEICKFYLMDCCMKSHICHYMHADFPCKYYYLGLECENKKPCKFLHGKALSDDMKTALVRHIIAAPRAILGDFKRMSKERVESMLETRNTQLLIEEGGTCIVGGNKNEANKLMGLNINDSNLDRDYRNEKGLLNLEISLKNFEQIEENMPDPGLKQSLQNFPDVFTELQLRTLSDIGIIWLHQLTHLSLAKLNEIGLSVVQINDLQQKSKRNQNDKPQKANTSDNTINCLKMNDSDSNMLPAEESELNNDESRINRDIHFKSDIAFTEAILDDILNPSTVLDELNTLDVLDDESKLVIDESACSASDNESMQSPWRNEDYQRAQDDKNSSNFGDNNEIGGDFDMRMPFVPVTDFIPATEIQASINSHAPIKYKLIEIYIPKNQQSMEINSSLNNLLDPRLKRSLQLKNNEFSEENEATSLNGTQKSTDKFPSPGNSLNTPLGGGLLTDPRKRKEVENSTTQSTIPNFQFILNGYLQKSRWYQEQKSHVKIHINQLLSRLSSELSRFHQNPNPGGCFELLNIDLAEKIDEVLFNLGIQVDSYGNISKRITETSPPAENVSSIPSLLTLNISDAPINFHGYQPSNNVPQYLPGSLLPPQRLDMPKPGLLGIAPGVEYPPPFPVPPPSAALLRFQNEIAHHRWQNCPPGPPFYHSQRPVGPPLGHPFDGRRGMGEIPSEARRRGLPFERRGVFKRLKRF